MQTSITSNSKSVEFMYLDYLENKLIVNRRYQRKLVWTILEKQTFIDSLLHKYSTPLFLFAQPNNPQNQQLEIIDGLQRLNAVMSFIENEYPIPYNGQDCYFNLQTLSRTKALLSAGELRQRTPILPDGACLEIVSYPLSISTLQADDKTIEEVFRRINSYGKQLSRQEIRQAGALGLFPELVRKISAYIRGDNTDADKVLLSKMKHFSLSNSQLDYGIKVADVFWVKQNIIPEKNMRISRDEELVAYILSYILVDKKIDATNKTLNVLYKYDLEDVDSIADKAEDSINKYGQKQIIDRFIKTFEVIQNTIFHSGKDFRTLVFRDTKSRGQFRSFQVIFLAIYESLFDGHRTANTSLLAQKLDGIGQRHLDGIGLENDFSGQLRAEKVAAVKSVIASCFPKTNSEDVAQEDWTLQLDNLLRNSVIEGTQYDFKTTLHTMTPHPKFDDDLFHRCIQTLLACVNKGPNTNGYVIVGVADKENTRQHFCSLYPHVRPDKIRGTSFSICGLDAEINTIYNGNTDKFQDKVLAMIRKEPISDVARNFLLTHIKFPRYYGKLLLVLHLASHNDVELYDNKRVFIREGNQTQEVSDMKTILSIQKRFN